jgi:hypothetical protein
MTQVFRNKFRYRHGQPATGSSGGLSDLVASDLTFAGQVQANHTSYMNPVLAVRYVAGERRFLVFDWQSDNSTTSAYPDHVGDLVEYNSTAALTNGSTDWVSSNVPTWTETRRWKRWDTGPAIRAGQIAGTYHPILQDYVNVVNGGTPAGFYWHEPMGILMYTWQPWYPGNPILWPAFSAVKLLDSEAGGNVGTTNIYGPWYFRNSTLLDDFKDGSMGMFPIPAASQAAMGGKFITVGHHAANIDQLGARSLGMWVVGDIPNPLPAPNATLWPGAVHLFDTSGDHASSGGFIGNQKVPNFTYGPVVDCSQAQLNWFGTTSSGNNVGMDFTSGNSVDDCLYQAAHQSYIDTVTVYMSTGCVGGTWVPEVYNGSTWVQPSSWAMSVGSQNLATGDNVFYWPKVPIFEADYALEGVHPRSVRLRRTAAGTSAGTVHAIVLTESVSSSRQSENHPLNIGGYDPPGTEQYDSSHNGWQYADFSWGGAWVRTANVEGVGYFMGIGTGARFYGSLPMYVQPMNGGTPFKIIAAHSASDGSFELFSTGERNEGPVLPCFTSFRPGELKEVIAGTRNGDNRGIKGIAFSHVDTTWPGLIITRTSDNPASPYYGSADMLFYGWGHSVFFDTVTNQLIVLWQLATDENIHKNILSFWNVR